MAKEKISDFGCVRNPAVMRVPETSVHKYSFPARRKLKALCPGIRVLSISEESK